jgi:hypothetical protein
MDIELQYFERPFTDGYDIDVPRYLDSILWEAQSIDIDIAVYDKEGNLLPDCEVTLLGQSSQGTLVSITDVNGVASFSDVIAYSSVYDLELNHETEGYFDQWSIRMLMEDDLVIQEFEVSYFDVFTEDWNYTIDRSLDSILWGAQSYDINITVYDDNDGDRVLLEGCEVTLLGYQSQDTLTGVTDSDGVVTFNDVISYNHNYGIEMRYNGRLNEYWGITLYPINDVLTTDFTLYFDSMMKEEVAMESMISNLDSILWIEI